MKRQGFTLIELSIVLIIIGLIVGSVMKGKDLINSASQKKIYNTWVNQWRVTINEYEDRTGELLGDGTLNGGTETKEDGYFDNLNLGTTSGNVHTVLKEVGLDTPTSNIASSNGGYYKIQGKYTTGVAVITLGKVHSSSSNAYKNVISIANVPTDVAIAFDKMTDGSANPASGDFQQISPALLSNGRWPDASKTPLVTITLKL